MSIATLARKSRAQRGASTRTGWTLATTKSGNCPGPCGGGAPAKQQSFRRLMKNKQQGGGPNPGGTNNDASGGDCCFTTWKKTNDPKGEQSIGYYLWRKKQLTHNCIPHCIPHREHYNPKYIYVTWTGDTLSGDALHGAKWQRWPVTAPGTAWLDPPWMWAANGGVGGGVPPPPHIFFDSQYGQGTGRWVADGGHAELISLHKGVGTHPPTTGWEYAGTPRPDDLKIVWSLPGKVCGYEAPCDNVGCKCNCNKSMGGTACCVVHKTMLPLSNSENIAWVVEERTCLQTSKPDPRNPNTC